MYFAHWPLILGTPTSGSLPVRPWQSSQYSAMADLPLAISSGAAVCGTGTQGSFAKYVARASIWSSLKPLTMRSMAIELRSPYFHSFMTFRRYSRGRPPMDGMGAPALTPPTPWQPLQVRARTSMSGRAVAAPVSPIRARVNSDLRIVSSFSAGW